MRKQHSFFPQLTKQRCMEFGLLVVLICSLWAYYKQEYKLILFACLFALMSLIAPLLFYPFAWCWFRLAAILNRLSTTVILALLYFLLVIPVGVVQRLLGRDPLRIRQFKKGQQSVMIIRNHIYEPQDLSHTF